MATLTRRRLLAMLGAGGGLLGLGYVLRSIFVDAWRNPMSSGGANAGPGFGGATGMDMSMYMEMFSRHNEIRRTVEEIPGGVRTTTESDSPDLAALLHEHVPSMYSHLDQGGEIMSIAAMPDCTYSRSRRPLLECLEIPNDPDNENDPDDWRRDDEPTARVAVALTESDEATDATEEHHVGGRVGFLVLLTSA
jgi:hypothetical protein